MSHAMRHHWLLLGACGWVLLILMFASKFINLNFRVPDDYGGKSDLLGWTDSALKHTRAHTPTHTRAHTHTPTAREPEPEHRPPSAGPSAGGERELQDWRPVAARRLQLLSSVCGNASLANLTHTPVSRFVLDRIFVCDKHKILFCQTPKVGNTQWKKVLIVLNGAFSTVEEIPENLVHDHEKNGLPRLSSMSEEGIQHRLSSYFKFFIVRDPFERLISAFKDKFVSNPRFEPWYKHHIGPAIVRKLDRQFGDHVIHWLSFAELCAPCEIRYSVVGHHETLERDAPFILQSAGIQRLVSYPTIPPGITRYNRTKVLRYFSGISKRDARRLYARYHGDFSLFGYPRPHFLLD
ncbi:hypothetical protein COCON_G00056520 [Conger conger]|uniref:Carbohydrate sulfotransferase n=1 Tax=Conger conger TaxID=82655 RepID=A0A9Q1DWQ0_CONCO|nr:hypothetical protein COCON_G00056520 [Conger conger]